MELNDGFSHAKPNKDPAHVSDLKRISKLLSLMLRHRPDEFGLNIDEYGYAPVEEVVEALQTKIDSLTTDDLMAMIHAPGQRRFEVNDKGVRAQYGHSFFVEMDTESEEPPEQLFIGCTHDQASLYKDKGIRPLDRSYIHLSSTREAAEARNRRVQLPCLAVVAAGEAHQNGVEFYSRGEIVLCREIPAAFISDIEHAEAGLTVTAEDPSTKSTVFYGRKPRKAARRR